ncbi:MAG: hypothetical protein QOH06_4113 [Acidobacteriota bacterium]|jgi:hypothetical protein|nr:hypothetical protein [Acidobacteriota bacterium]
MSLIEMHSALARLYVDETFLQSFCARPDQALARYDLTPREAAALAGIDRDAVKKYAASLRSKTRGRFEHAYRLLLALDEAAFHKYYLRFYELRPIRPYETFNGPTVELGQFLERSFTDNPEVPPYAADLARYQRLFYQARFEPRAGTAPPAASPAGLDLRTRLRLAPGVRIERFQYDMAALEETLRKGERPQDVQRATCEVVFQSLPEVGRARKFQISKSTAGLLSQCDGTRELGDAAARLEADWEAVAEAAAKLVRLGLLEEEVPAG